MATTTNTTDSVINLMAHGLQEGNRCQWQEIYFIGHYVVRYDRILSKQELASIDWTDVYNTLVKSYYKVYLTQSLAKPEQAIDPTKKLSGGWKMGVVTRNADQIAVAYRPVFSGLVETGFYQVSFVKFTRWKSGAVASAVKKLFYSQSL